MDEQKSSPLLSALQAVSDPRKARGQRHGWGVIMAVMAAALASGQPNGRGIGPWVPEQADELIARRRPARKRLPSPSTLRRALRAVDLTALEAEVAAFTMRWSAPEPTPAPIVTASGVGREGLAVDGKAVRGVKRSGAALSLVRVGRHHRGIGLAHAAIPAGRREQATVPELVATCDLCDTVVTLDAWHTHASLAQQIRTQQGHALMIVKANQPTRYRDIALLFDGPPWQSGDDADEVPTDRTFDTGHGRLETRTLDASTAWRDSLDWPDVEPVLRRHCRRVIPKTGQISEETTDAIRSVPRALAGASHFEVLGRAHGTIENRDPSVRDVTCGEDSRRLRVGQAPHALATLRTAIISLCRANDWRSIPDALRHYGASVDRALRLIGAPGL